MIIRPARQGQGGELIGEASPYRQEADISLRFPGGSRRAIAVPLPAEGGTGRACVEGFRTMTGSLAGKRILVVEDEYFIASDLKRALQKADAIVVGPVGDIDLGLSLVARDRLDAAVLDVNLEGTTSYPIADRLAAQAVPYLFLTGYDGWALPEPYRAVPRVPKPFPMRAVLACVGQLIGMEVVP